MSYCNECPNHDACDTGCIIGAARLSSTPGHAMTEEQEKWYARETAAFRAWWEASGEKTYSETPTMAAGAGWLKRAEAASSEKKERACSYIKNAERAPVLLTLDGDPVLVQPGSELEICHEFPSSATRLIYCCQFCGRENTERV